MVALRFEFSEFAMFELRFAPVAFTALCENLPPPFASFFGARSWTFTPFLPLSFFCAMVFYLLLWLLGCWGVGGAEDQLSSTANALFWDQVVQADQLIFRTLLLLMFLISSLRTFLWF